MKWNPRDEADLWPAAAALLAAGDYDAVWVAVPGTRLATGVTEELLADSDGDAVAVTVAAAGPCLRRRLHHGLLLPGRWRIVSGPPVMIGIRATAAARLGGLDLDAGPGVAPGLELFERARRAGETVAAAEITQATHVYAGWRPWRRPEWRRQRARGTLVIRGHPDGPIVLDALRAAGEIVHGSTRHPKGARWGAVALGGLIHGLLDARPRGGPWRK